MSSMAVLRERRIPPRFRPTADFGRASVGKKRLALRQITATEDNLVFVTAA